jgi:hypothetical protein
MLPEVRKALQLPPDQGLPALDLILARLVLPTPFRSSVVCSRAALLGQQNRPEFKTAAAECFRLMPTNPLALGMYAASRVFEADPVPTVKAYLAAIRVAPGLAESFDTAQMQILLDRLNEVRQPGLASELLRELNRVGYGAANPVWASNAALRSIYAAVETGKPETATTLLPAVINVADAKALLVDKTFAPLSIDIRAWAADGLVTQREAYLAATRGAFEVDPSLPHRRDYADAMLQAGRRLDAINLLRAGLIDPSGWDEDRWEVVMTAIRLANILSDDDRTGEGIAVLEKLDRELAGPKARRSAVNIVPNLARLYIETGRFTDAVALLDRAGLTKYRFQVEAHRGYAAALRGCALAGAGRSKEAAVFREELDNDKGTTRGARRLLIGCLGDQAAADREVIASLDDLRDRRSMLVELRSLEVQPARKVNDFSALMRKALANPAVRAKLDTLSAPVAPAYQAALRSWSQDKAEGLAQTASSR